MRKSSIIDVLLYSKQDLTVVKENLELFDHVFKLLTEVHQQHCKLLSDEKQHTDNQWFEDLDEVFSFKHHIYNWVRENKEDKRPSSKSSAKSRSSGRSSGTRSTSSSKSSTRERAIEKLKMAESMVETSFIEKKHRSRYQTEKLEFEEKVAKSSTKVKVFEELEQPTTALRS